MIRIKALSKYYERDKVPMKIHKISIVTVVWNDVIGIKNTIESIINQTYGNIELIVIDGGSTDGTVDIIKQYEEEIDYWVSEKDAGIYDAMNKGINVSTGTWVNFMNAGDIFTDHFVLEKICKNFYQQKVLLYGHHIANGNPYRTKSPNRLKLGNIFACHQSMFFNKKLLKDKLYYDVSYKIFADYELVNRLFLEDKSSFLAIDEIIAIYDLGGVSQKVSWQKRKDKYRAVFNYYGYSGLIKAIFYRAYLTLEKKR